MPTFAEARYPVDFLVPLCVFAPKGTPTAIVEKLSAVLNRVAKEPEMIEYFKKLRIVTVGTTPAEAVAYIAADRDRITKVIIDVGLAANP